MRTYLLRWNPAISSVKHDGWRCIIRYTAWYEETNWSIYEWQQAERGDRFYMLLVGAGITGVVASGWFTSNPYEDEDWAGTGHKRYYVDLIFDTILDPENATILSTQQLQSSMPHLTWNTGHSGVLLSEADADTLLGLWSQFLEDHSSQFYPDNDYTFRSLRKQAHGIALNAHNHQLDKGGEDYFKSHIQPVVNMAEYIEDKDGNVITEIVAYLHDTVEDTSWTFDLLFKYGFTQEMLTALDCVTRREGESYDQFIDRILPNPIARAVKIADLRSNMDITRLPQLTDEDLQRLSKYHKAYRRLMEAGG